MQCVLHPFHGWLQSDSTAQSCRMSFESWSLRGALLLRSLNAFGPGLLSYLQYDTISPPAIRHACMLGQA